MSTQTEQIGEELLEYIKQESGDDFDKIIKYIQDNIHSQEDRGKILQVLDVDKYNVLFASITYGKRAQRLSELILDLNILTNIIIPDTGDNAFLEAVQCNNTELVKIILRRFNISHNYVQDDIEAQRALPDTAALLTRILTLNDGNILCNVARENGMDIILDEILKTLSNVFGSPTSDKFRRVLQSKNIDSGVPLENKWINEIQKDDNQMQKVAVKHFLNAKIPFSLPYQLQGRRK